MATTADDILEMFESSFRDQEVVPRELELKWLEKAVAIYSVEQEPLQFDRIEEVFSDDLDPFVVSLLAQHMRVFYQEREVSKVNHRVSIVTKDISIDGNGNGKTAAREELKYHSEKAEEMEGMLFDTAYAD